MKEDLKNFQSQNTKTVCFISALMVLATITQLLEGNFLLMDEISQWVIAALIGTSIAAFLAWFNKSGSDFKDGFVPKNKRTKKKK